MSTEPRLSAEAVADITNREMAARLLDRAAIMGGSSLGAALESMGDGFRGTPYDLAWETWARVCDETHDTKIDGGHAALQRIAAARLRGRLPHPRRAGMDGEVFGDWFWWRGAWRPM